MFYTRAIVQAPSRNYAEGLTTVSLGTPEYPLAVKQHAAYCEALAVCGVKLISLPPDERYADSTFVEDTAVITPRGAIIARPGAASRTGEVDVIKQTLCSVFPDQYSIKEPDTLDGGDVCEARNHFFIGISKRTNESGAKQLAGFLAEFGYTSSLIDIRNLSNILHLKSGLAYLGNGRLVVIDALKQCDEFIGYDVISITPDEEYAANCLLVNDRLLIAAGFPKFEKQLSDLGYQTIVLEMSEFQKMDGGLSCLSIRF